MVKVPYNKELNNFADIEMIKLYYWNTDGQIAIQKYKCLNN